MAGRRRLSVAQQVFLLQIVAVLVTVAVAGTLAFVDERDRQYDEATRRSVTIARSVADAPSVLAALAEPDPSVAIEPYAERVREHTGTDFVVVMGLDRVRYSHPDRSQLGKRFIGGLGDAPRGGTYTERSTGTLGPSVRAVVPVLDRQGRVVAMVAVGITIDRIDAELRQGLLRILLAAVLLLVVGGIGAWTINRRLRRQTHGLGEQEITRMYEYYDAVLHAVREGMLLLDPEGRVVLVNDEARRLLGLPADATGRLLDRLGIPPELAASLAGGDAGPDEIHVVDDLVLVVNQAPATSAGRPLGSVVTLRDHTELRAVSGELDTVRGLTETLRSQNHEAANRLHTVVSLIELGRPEEAVDFATAELEAAQLLADRALASGDGDAVVPALLLGKTAQAADRGIELAVDPDTLLVDPFVPAGDLVTLVGNLVDNAFDAVAAAPRKRVEVSVVCDEAGLVVDVEDSGPGLPTGYADRVFDRGWSTKRGDEALGRGLGLALVGQVARRYGGQVTAGVSPLGGAAFRVEIPRERP